jgi:murein DD-endopeptidase MepM/ murein hydrolase activator NlpD
VDTFDFPLDPPNGEEAASRHGFGNYSSRYEKYHAGEDWGIRNKPNFGESVHSIGHGQVTYAAPNGWGLDKGTVVIRHVFPWGGYVLSFYGHLDPPSVTIRTGDCVQRGEKIGEIGNPRTPPHLHFEIRLHLPISTGQGYWSTDPSKIGWLPPSQTIWETRLKASPGIVWTQPYAEGLTLGLGMYQGEYLLAHGGKIMAVDPQEGSVAWQQTIPETTRYALLDVAPGSAKNAAQFVGADQLYLLDLMGDLTAYSLRLSMGERWKLSLSAYSSAQLYALPVGGVLVIDRRQAIAVSPEGQILWEAETGDPLRSWILIDDQFVFSAGDTIWTADKNGVEDWGLNIGGNLVEAGGEAYLYADDGLYRLDTLTKRGKRIVDLKNADLDLGTITTTLDDGLILLHADGYDRWLLHYDPNGNLVWERSLKKLPRGRLQLITNESGTYLLVVHSSTSGIKADLYRVDTETAGLTHILRSGSHRAYSRNSWILPMDAGLMLVNVGGGPLAAFDPRSALDRMNIP